MYQRGSVKDDLGKHVFYLSFCERVNNLIANNARPSDWLIRRRRRETDNLNFYVPVLIVEITNERKIL